MDSFLGAIFAFGFNFAPQNTANEFHICDGSLLSINDYQALYSLLGTTYGGDGTTTFGIPNLQGVVPIGCGQGTGLANYPLGSTGGAMQYQLTQANIPGHTHAITVGPMAAGGPATTNNPVKAYFGQLSGTTNMYNSNDQVAGNTKEIYVTSDNTSDFGDNASPIATIAPYQVVTYCICTIGAYPPNPAN